MTDRQEVDALLAELEQARQATAELRSQLEQLQSLPQARAAYEAALGQETNQKQALEQQILGLQAEKTRLLSPSLPQTRRIIGHSQGNNPAREQQRHPDNQTTAQGATTRLVSEEERRAYRQLEVIRRFALRLGAQDNLELINKILSDPGQPRGAVLFLVNWEAFTQPLPSETNQEKYLSRLRESRAALLEYQERLKADIVALQVQYGGLLGVWKVWRTRESGPQGWAQLIEQNRIALRDEIVRLQQERAVLEDEIAAWRTRDEGGAP